MFDFQTAEYSVIGCILIDSRCLGQIQEVLPSPDSFGSDSCRKAYHAALDLQDSKKAIDPVTIGKAAGLGYDFLAQCMELTPSCAGAEQYAKTVLEGHRRRQLRDLAGRLQADAMSPDRDPEVLLTEIGSELDKLISAPGKGIVRPQKDCLADFLTYRAEVNGGTRQAIASGFPGLDRILGGFAQGGLYILAARPGVGKSALGIALADMMAKERTVLYASLEMTAEELNARRVAAISDAECSYNKLLFGKTTEADDIDIINGCGKLYERKLFLSALSSLTVPELELQARSTHAQVVMVDYLGLLSGRDPRQSEYDRITQISGDLKRMSKRLNCVTVALCQLNRESTAPGTETRPKLSQLRSSGALEQDADGVLLLHRPEYGQVDAPKDRSAPQPFLIDVAKNRHGRTGTAELSWYAPVNRFEDHSGRWVVKSWM